MHRPALARVGARGQASDIFFMLKAVANSV
jgi:hypothetical protein